ncbi:MAG TPA: serine/threonine-protein kinase [Polyangiaceae bacterium]
MSQRFIRCVYCGLPHDVNQSVCPATGKAIDRRRLNTSSIPAQREPIAGPPSNGPFRARPVSPPAALAPAPAPPPVRHVSTVPPRQAHRDLLGKTIGGKYLVRSVLGEGGMGAVYEAENLALGRSVAMKVLHPAQARKKVAVKRFHQEARAAGAIGHPNICEVYDLGTLDDGSPYLVMERLVGETLADRIASEGGLPFDDVIDVCTQVLSGLVAAHEKGIVHRDIKPENIFLTRRVGCPPVAKLLDFGVSKMIAPIMNEKDEDLDLTRTGMVMGTPFYMSPEQARGDRNLDARVDLYACGVIIYEAITGKRPFTAANYNALLLQILTTSPRPARELRPALPQGFDEVLDKALARNREDRFQSAAAFQRELQTLRDRHPMGATGIDASLARQMMARKVSTPTTGAADPPPQPSASAVRGRVEPPPPPPPRAWLEPSPAPRARLDPPRPPPEPVEEPIEEPTPSSVEIPILFSDTPLSGEQFPDLDAGATAIEDRPREMHERFPSSSDTDTTERRADLSHLAFGKRPRAGNVARALVRATTTERGKAPAIDLKNTDTDQEDNNATLIQPMPVALPNLRRRTTTQKMIFSPDDTVRMDGDTTTDVRDARDRLPSAPAEPAVPPRSPKLPRT